MGSNWTEQANCRGMDVHIFFPERGMNHRVSKIVKEVCSDCPVKAECLELGMEHDDSDCGYFGGLSHNQRRKLKSQRRVA
jgi:WhiB family redox-sensing transcriptional regulator